MAERCNVVENKFDVFDDIFFHGKVYFGYINESEGHTEGFWNAPDAETHAQAPLGELTHVGKCWRNETAEICIR